MQKLNPDVKKKWVEVLRSGKYEQTQARLRRRIGSYVNGTGAYAYCCLGVLCDLHRKEKHRKGYNDDDTYLGEVALLPSHVRKWSGMSREVQNRLIDLNDNTSWSFNQIAAYIERYL